MLCNRQQLPNQSVLLGPVSATRGVPYGTKKLSVGKIFMVWLLVKLNLLLLDLNMYYAREGGQGVCYVGYA